MIRNEICIVCGKPFEKHKFLYSVRTYNDNVLESLWLSEKKAETRCEKLNKKYGINYSFVHTEQICK